MINAIITHFNLLTIETGSSSIMKNIILFLVVGVIVILVIRELVTWYYKINKIVRLQEKQIQLMEDQTKLLKEQNALIRRENNME